MLFLYLCTRFQTKADSGVHEGESDHPVFNESGSIGHVLTDIPRDIVNEVIVVNNGSTDDSPE